MKNDRDKRKDRICGMIEEAWEEGVMVEKLGRERLGGKMWTRRRRTRRRNMGAGRGAVASGEGRIRYSPGSRRSRGRTCWRIRLK